MTATPSTTQPEDFVGREFAGVRVEELLNRGGMGVVYRGTRIVDDRPVAVKFLNRDDMQQPQLKERFFREVQAAATVEHPNVVRIFDGGEQHGFCYITMEYVRGLDLFDYLEQHRQLPEAEAVRIFAALLDALHNIHRAGLVHRDIKPENILLADNTVPKLTDFGLARSVHQTTLTAAGMVLGTPLYMAPEQFKTSKVDPRADLYAVGCVMYHAITGSPPYEGDFVTLARQHREATPVPPRQRIPDLSAHIEAVILRLMAKKPEFRFPSADIARRALLGETHSGTSAAVRPQSGVETGDRLRRGALNTAVISSGAGGNTTTRKRRQHRASTLMAAAEGVPKTWWISIGATVALGVVLIAGALLFTGDPASTSNHASTHSGTHSGGSGQTGTLTRAEVERQFEIAVGRVNRCIVDQFRPPEEKEAAFVQLRELAQQCPNPAWLDELTAAASRRQNQPLMIRAERFNDLLTRFGAPLVTARIAAARDYFATRAANWSLDEFIVECEQLREIPPAFRADEFPDYRDFAAQIRVWSADAQAMRGLIAEGQAADSLVTARNVAVRMDALQTRTRLFNGTAWMANVRRQLFEKLFGDGIVPWTPTFSGEFTVLPTGTYLVTDKLVVPAGHELAIMPGCKVVFASSATFTVNGHLHAMGRSDLLVEMTAQSTMRGWNGVFVQSGRATLIHTIISNGRGTSSTDADKVYLGGGSLFGHNATLDITSCEFTRGHILGDGSTTQNREGGALLLIDCTTTIRSSKITNNEVPAGTGGAIRVIGGQLSVTETTFANNHTSGLGGALYASHSARIRIENGEFRANAASMGGALALSELHAAEIIDCEFRGNSAVYRGGALFIDKCEPAIRKCRFVGNTALHTPSSGHYHLQLPPADSSRFIADLRAFNTFTD